VKRPKVSVSMSLRRRLGYLTFALFAGVVSAFVLLSQLVEREGQQSVLEEREGYERDQLQDDPLGGFVPRNMDQVSYAATLGQHPSMQHLGFYDPATDPWIKADRRNTYKFWSTDYDKKQGDGTAWSGPEADEAEEKALDEEEPDELPDRDNRKNGWQQAEFTRWIQKQGQPASDFWQGKGFEQVGGEYNHAFRRLGIKSFGDLAAFNPDTDVPGGPCAGENSYLVSGHSMCGQLGEIVNTTNATHLWFADDKVALTPDDIEGEMRRVKQRVRRFRHSLAGDRPFDDRIMFCYSMFPEDPEYSQCIEDIEDAKDPVTGKIRKGRGWAALTKGLWTRHANGAASSAGSADLMGASWSQLTADLWNNLPYKENNGMQS
jgi:hypothetical protein